MKDRHLQSRRRLYRTRYAFVGLLSTIGVYLISAYLVLPQLWDIHEWQLETFDSDPRLTETGDKHPGDPLNLALVGTDVELTQAMKAAG